MTTTAITGNPTNNPIIAADSDWQNKYNQDTSPNSGISTQEKNDADTLTGNIYDALHSSNVPDFSAVTGAVNDFAASHGNDPVSQDLQSLLAVAKFEGDVYSHAGSSNTVFNSQVSGSKQVAQSLLTDNDYAHLGNFTKTALGNQDITIQPDPPPPMGDKDPAPTRG